MLQSSLPGLQMMVASAEEAVGLTELLYKFNALPTNPKVRSAACRITRIIEHTSACLFRLALAAKQIRCLNEGVIIQYCLNNPCRSQYEAPVVCIPRLRTLPTLTLTARAGRGADSIRVRPRQLRLPVRADAA